MRRATNSIRALPTGADPARLTCVLIQPEQVSRCFCARRFCACGKSGCRAAQQSPNPIWERAVGAGKDKWADDGIPENYVLQVRHYLAVMNMNKAYIACLYGNNENEFVYRCLERDRMEEEEHPFLSAMTVSQSTDSEALFEDGL